MRRRRRRRQREIKQGRDNAIKAERQEQVLWFPIFRMRHKNMSILPFSWKSSSWDFSPEQQCTSHHLLLAHGGFSV